MITISLFVAAAALGALVRTSAGHRLNRHNGVAYGTLLVNVAASFCAGLLWNVTGPEATVIAVGGLGTLSTFSSFARDTVALAEVGQMLRSAGYVAATLVGSVAAAAAAVTLVT